MRALLAVGLGVILVAACGSEHSSSDAGTGGDSCMNRPAACGGNLVGTWKVVDLCFDPVVLPSDIADQCPNATFNVTNVKVTGTFTYKADMTFSQSTNITGTVTLVLPGSCLQGIGAGSCTEIESSVNSDPSQAPLSCATTPDGGCQCSSALTDSEQFDGTYSTSGTSLSAVASDGSTDEQNYCVKNDSLYVIDPQMGMAMAGTLTGSFVLSK